MRCTRRVNALLVPACAVGLLLLAFASCEGTGGKAAFPNGAGNGGASPGFAWGGQGGTQPGFGHAGGGGVEAGFPKPVSGGGSRKPIGAICESEGECASGTCANVGSEPDEWKDSPSGDNGFDPSAIFKVCTQPCEVEGEDLSQGSCPTGSMCTYPGFCMPACGGDCHVCAAINENLSCDSDVCRCYSDICYEGFGADERGEGCEDSGGGSAAASSTGM